MVPSLRAGSEIFHDYDGGFEEGGFGLGRGAGIADGELNEDTPPPACAIEIIATFGFAPLVSTTGTDGAKGGGAAGGGSGWRMSDSRSCALLHFGGLVRLKTRRARRRRGGGSSRPAAAATTPPKGRAGG